MTTSADNTHTTRTAAATVDAPRSGPRLLDVHQLTAGYGDFLALDGLDLSLGEGEVLAIIGANGAGKTTLLRALSGALPIKSGRVRLGDTDISGWPAHRCAEAGVAMVPEGRRLFPSLSVEENLLMGAYAGRKGQWDMERVFTLFPILREFRKRHSTELSGGQQQMVALGRALMGNPRLMLCDELSLGLAPTVVKDIYRALPDIRAGGLSLVLVEQDIGQALKVADRVLCLQEGRIALEGTPATLSREQIAAAYFGS